MNSLASILMLVLIIVIFYFIIRHIKKKTQTMDEKIKEYKPELVNSATPPGEMALSMDNIEKIRKLHELQKEGVISEEEFNQQKTALMHSSGYDRGAQHRDVGDIPGAGIKALSFFIPIVGLVLFLVWHNDYPNKAKAAGKFALIGFIVVIAVWVFMILIIPSLFMYSMY
jgi:competence protein ComGC